MKNVLPNLHILKAVDGTLSAIPERVLHDDSVVFHHLCGAHRRWGALACWLTRLHAFEWQIRNNVTHMVLLEDDLHLKPTFARFICGEVSALFSDCATLGHRSSQRRAGCGGGRSVPFIWQCSRHGSRSGCGATAEMDLVQMDRFGEVYVASLAGARRLVSKLRAYGVRGCIDQQLNDPRIMNLSSVWSREVKGVPRPWRLAVRTNEGDIGKSERITTADVQRLKRRHPLPQRKHYSGGRRLHTSSTNPRPTKPSANAAPHRERPPSKSGRANPHQPEAEQQQAQWVVRTSHLVRIPFASTNPGGIIALVLKQTPRPSTGYL